MKRILIMFASILLAFAAAAQDGPAMQIMGACKDGKLVAIQIIVPAPGIVTIPIPADVCAVKPKPKRETARKAGPST